MLPPLALVNAAFDRVPRTDFHVGSRRVPAFRSAGIVGYVVGAQVALASALRVGLAPSVAVGVVVTAGLSFFGWGLVRRALTGRETLVLLECTWMALAWVWGFLVVADAPVRAGIDVLAVGLCPFLAIGRLGCLMVGCCHGHPGAVGPRYVAASHLAPRLVNRRLLPVALVESGMILGIGAVAFAFADQRAGTATVWFLLSYAIGRFALEGLRGDHRPRLLGISVARLACAGQFVAGMALAEAWLVPGGLGRGSVSTAIVVSVAAVAGLVVDRRRWSSHDRWLDAPHLDELHALVTELGRGVDLDADPVTERSRAGVSVAVSRSAVGIHVSLAHDEAPVDALARALHGPDILVLRGVAHWLESDLDVSSRAPAAGPDGDGGTPDRAEPPSVGAVSSSPKVRDGSYFGATNLTEATTSDG